ncbi:MAG TPA: hypothetical protein VH253_13135 [Phycisphaerae bacterium]|nr:hypothetical protein [Phycisphaerae bacterium]
MKRRGSLKTPETHDFGASDSYLRHVREFALRPLRDKAEYRTALDILGRLAMREGLDSGEHDYVAALSRFVGDYEERRHRASMQKLPPLDLLRQLMQENNMNTTDLGYILGSRGLASEVLNGKRGLSKTLIRRLADRFNVHAELFL